MHNSGKIIKKSRTYYHKIDSSEFFSRGGISDIIKKGNKGYMGAGNVSTLGGSYVHIYLIIIQIH